MNTDRSFFVIFYGVILRSQIQHSVQVALGRSRVVALVGPRQSGKTTIAREFVAVDSANYFDLEDPVSLARLEEPKTALEGLRGLVVIDEVQRRPELFPILRVLADRLPQPAQFLILGSASPELLSQSSESLAGRIEVLEMAGFSLFEVGDAQQESLWLRGGFPLSYLVAQDSESFVWRQQFIRSFFERDLLQFHPGVAPATMMRFATMLAHYHAQTWNASEIASSLGVTPPTCRRYLDALSGAFLIRQLQPWHENLGKRQVKAPKIYFRDSGLFHSLCGIRTQTDLLTNPKLGASWEGFALEEVIRQKAPDEVYFWGIHSGAELDLLMVKDGVRTGVEFKRADAPKLTASIKTAIKDLKLEQLTILYPGKMAYSLAENVEVKPIGLMGVRD
ncbi:MAG: ATP-binding protein [Chthoniobacteraceae bacterium]|nr:ATP-binding protein [Chthoniobacteraceae bacterium]